MARRACLGILMERRKSGFPSLRGNGSALTADITKRTKVAIVVIVVVVVVVIVAAEEKEKERKGEEGEEVGRGNLPRKARTMACADISLDFRRASAVASSRFVLLAAR